MAKKRKSSRKKSSPANRKSTAVKRVAPFLTVERLVFAGEITLIRLAEALSKLAKTVDDPEAVVAAAAAFDEQVDNGDWPAALVSAGGLLTLLPDNPYILCNQGALRLLTGDVAGAVEALTQAIDIDAGLAPAYYLRGLAAYELEDPEGERGDLDAAIGDLGQAIKADPQFAPAYLRRGYALFAAMNLNASLKTFEDYSRLVPHDPDGFNNQAFLLLNMDRTARAEAAWARATSLPDAPAYAHAGHAVALYMLKKRDPAAEQYRKAIELDPQWRDDLEAHAQKFNWPTAMIETAEAILSGIES